MKKELSCITEYSISHEDLYHISLSISPPPYVDNPACLLTTTKETAGKPPHPFIHPFPSPSSSPKISPWAVIIR